MIKVHVAASREYEVLIERGLMVRAGRLVSQASGAKKALIVSDDNVYPLYGKMLESSLQRAGIEAESLVFPHGEQTKCLANYEKILTRLSARRLGRSDAVVALGGGVIGDLAGFAAATFQRGMELVQVPTSLLAAVDSAVGGKTAVNLPTGKNQVGCFYQPALVLCDTDCLETLPEREYKCGAAEVIKYAVLRDEAFFEGLMAAPISLQPEAVIERCVAMKRDLVAEDEFDRGSRQLLNLGHTIGHGVEACSGFQVLHGQAVAIGMAAISRAAVKKKLCGEESLQRLLRLLDKYGLPTELEYSVEELYSAILADKKLSSGRINLIIPEKIGRCRIESRPVEEMRDWLAAGGAK